MTNQEKQLDELIRNSLLNELDLDMEIYRIFPLWLFEDLLRLKQLTLVSPQTWEDPYEVIGEPIAVNLGNGKQEIINQSLPPVFAQCWSETAESDTLLRAYSRVVKDPISNRNTCPRDEGVRVKSTPRKLLQALIAGTPPTLNGCWFFGSIQYLRQDALLQTITNAIGKHGLDVFESPPNRARLLLLKREAFSHEAELRVLFHQREGNPVQQLLKISINPLDVFEEISFDPRLEAFERKERETVARNFGFNGDITESGLYHRTLLQVVMPQSYNKKQ